MLALIAAAVSLAAPPAPPPPPGPKRPPIIAILPIRPELEARRRANLAPGELTMCSKSFALGRWRKERGLPRTVRLAAIICPESYAAGFEAGRTRTRGQRR